MLERHWYLHTRNTFFSTVRVMKDTPYCVWPDIDNGHCKKDPTSLLVSKWPSQ